ncbi:hypothetical protein ANAPC5_01357 [Anaplasma phagocytophilum]|nr:hypothetical protein ANAPC5_01357 [Anaplasma phagocytophilum]
MGRQFVKDKFVPLTICCGSTGKAIHYRNICLYGCLLQVNLREDNFVTGKFVPVTICCRSSGGMAIC